MLSENDFSNIEEVLYAIRHIEEYTEDIPNMAALKDKAMAYDAVMMNFILIGEACKRLSADLKNNHPHIDWKGINSYRNFIAHDYFGVDDKIVWLTITIELPALKNALSALLPQG